MFKLVKISLLIAFLSSSALAQEVSYPDFILGSKVMTENKKATDTTISSWKLDQEISLQYNVTENFYVSGAVDLERHHDYGYHFTAGAQLPMEWISPFMELSYNHQPFQSNKIDYDMGLSFKTPFSDNFIITGQVTDLIEEKESWKAGAQYFFTNNFSVGMNYWMRFDNKENGAELVLSYAI